jgi:Phage-related minor tail protein
MMAGTVLDSFILEFSLDPSAFTAGQRKVIDDMRKVQEQALRQATEVESTVKKTFDLLSNFKREALTAIGIFFGGRELGEFVRYVTNLDAATGRLATTLGMSAEETSAWQGALKQAGGTAEDANSSLSGLSSEMSRFQLTGQSAMLPVLSRLGISLYDSNRNLKTAGDLWLELSAAVQGMNAREATAFLQMIPGATQSMINFALMGPQAMREYIAAARQAGVTTAQSAAEAREYQTALARLEQSSTGLGRTLLVTLEPALTAIANAMTRVIQLFTQTTPTGARSAIQDKFAQFGVGAPASGYSNEMLSARQALAEKLKSYSGPNTGNANFDNFLSGLSFLETDQRNVGNATSSAQGYFQFLKGTSQKARAAGLQDPSVGSYQDQASATMAYIRHFYPQAAAAIDKGDYAKAIPMLRGEWPSLPGGSQPQSMGRYSTFGAMLGGAGTGAGGGRNVTVNGVNVTINANHVDADGIGHHVDEAIRRSVTAGAANYGSQ